MGTSLQEIDARVQVEGKDSNNQFPAQRQKFIQDACIEVSTSQNYYWLWETLTLTVPNPNTSWFKISDDFHKVERVSSLNSQVTLPNGSPAQQYYTYIPETELVDSWWQVNNDGYGRFRLKWDETTSEFQMALINAPASGSTLNVLIKKYYTIPDRFPPFMEEVIVRGAVARFTQMLEGSDLDYADQMLDEYRTLAKQHEKLGNNTMNQNPRVAKTQAQLDENRTLNVWRNS